MYPEYVGKRMANPSPARVLYHHYYRLMRMRKGVNLRGYPSELERECVARAFATICDVSVEFRGWRNQNRRRRFLNRRLSIDNARFGWSPNNGAHFK